MTQTTPELPDSEAEEVRGYIYTHFDCPNCNEMGEVEGDAGGDEIECRDCGAKFRISHVV